MVLVQIKQLKNMNKENSLLFKFVFAVNVCFLVFCKPVV